MTQIGSTNYNPQILQMLIGSKLKAESSKRSADSRISADYADYTDYEQLGDIL
jgi:hypothetical protein